MQSSVCLDCKAEGQSKETPASHTQMEQSESHIALCVGELWGRIKGAK